MGVVYEFLVWFYVCCLESGCSRLSVGSGLYHMSTMPQRKLMIAMRGDSERSDLLLVFRSKVLSLENMDLVRLFKVSGA